MLNLIDYLPTIPDFPKPGIMFKDISPLLADKDAFSHAMSELHRLSLQTPFDYILGIESRGFIFASALAQISNKGLIMARKPNKLPTETYSEFYGLEYGQDYLEVQQNIIPQKAKILLMDDVLATGGTITAAASLVNKAGAQVAGALVLLEITELLGRKKLSEAHIETQSLIEI